VGNSGSLPGFLETGRENVKTWTPRVLAEKGQFYSNLMTFLKDNFQSKKIVQAHSILKAFLKEFQEKGILNTAHILNMLEKNTESETFSTLIGLRNCFFN
jgi:hypothetical protein